MSAARGDGVGGRGSERTWDRVAGLELIVDGYSLERLEMALRDDFARTTTVIRLHGAGRDGLGEDVTYANEDHDALAAAGAILPLAGSWTLESFSAHLASLDQFPAPPHSEVYRRYRNWAFESAALDLALNQAGESLHALLGRPPQPLRFVASLRLSEPPTLEPIERRLAQHPDLQEHRHKRELEDNARADRAAPRRAPGPPVQARSDGELGCGAGRPARGA